VRRTATTGNAILGLLALRESWSSWELTGQLRRNMRFFWPRAESRIYDEAKALVGRGLAVSERTYVGRRPRTIYSITPAGRRALAAWLQTPPRPTNLECEPVLRILLGRLATSEQLLRATDQVRADAEAILAVGRVVSAEYAAGTAPFQDDVAYRSLVFDFLTSHAQMMLAWSERAESAITAMARRTEEQKSRDGVRRVAQVRTTYPEPH
jgi:PadR family transcriptional regulator, regulatory protein AphA